MINQPTYKVTKLRAGTVIDHVSPGRAFEALRVLALGDQTTVAIGLNWPSSKQGRKDLIKVEDVFLSKEAIDRLSLITPGVTISIIKDFEVTEKVRPQVPPEARGLVRCANRACITNNERDVETRFRVSGKEALVLTCHYCERSFGQELFELT